MERYLLWWWLLYELNDACVVLLIAPSSFPKNFFVRSKCWCVSIIPIMTASSKWYTCTSVRKMVWASKGSFWRSSVASVISVGQKPLSGSFFYPSFLCFPMNFFSPNSLYFYCDTRDLSFGDFTLWEIDRPRWKIHNFSAIIVSVWKK